jgi:N-methylhydantoinase A
MRYLGQGWEIPVPLPDRAFGPDDAAGLQEAFRAAYARHFGRAIDGLEGLEIEIVTWSVRVVETLPAPARLGLVLDGPEVTATSVRAVFDPALGQPLPTAIVAREGVSAGQSLQGPAVIAERETSTVVTSRFQAVMQGDGSLLLLRKGGMT